MSHTTRVPCVLFLCTGNSCRSQMAEGWARHLHGDRLDAMSAGTHPKGIDPLAVRVMAESGVDIHGQTSKLLNPSLFKDGPRRVGLVVTVCDAAAAACPMPPPGNKDIQLQLFMSYQPVLQRADSPSWCFRGRDDCPI